MSYGQFPCPHCGHKMTRVSVTVGTRRNRQCGKCNTRFTTYEISAPEFRAVRAMRHVVTQAVRDLALLPVGGRIDSGGQDDNN